tara:strand:- start:4278 stop:4856 length:579 start_codon:yes stop_codon:yes gene_type:complete
MQIVLATHNKGKMVELDNLLPSSYEVLTLDQFPEIGDIAETGKTLKENAFIKSDIVNSITGLPALGDDTGLEVDALDGQPGIFSARYAGDNATYNDNCDKLLTELKSTPFNERKARFRTVIAFSHKDRRLWAEGIVEGSIAIEPKGASGFGYDSIFFYPPLKKTFAELEKDEKNSISHRGNALRNFLVKFKD